MGKSSPLVPGYPLGGISRHRRGTPQLWFTAGMTLISMPLEGGGEILIEAADEQRGNQRVGRRDGITEATETVQAAMSRIRPAAEAVLDELRAMEQQPSKISLQFGIKVTGEANLAVAKTAGEANFTVNVEWNAPKDA